MLVTKEKLVEAARKNGLPHSRRGWFLFGDLATTTPYEGDYEVVEACVLGQAVVNLGIHHIALANALGKVKGVDDYALYDNVVRLNDQTSTPYDTICDFLENHLPADFTFEAVPFEYGKGDPFNFHQTAPKQD